MADVGLNPYGEAFRGLDGNRHFAKIAIADIRPGDILTLDPRGGETIGHNVIAYDHYVVGAASERAMTARYGADARAFFAAHRGPIHAIVVDSSWGAGPHGDTSIGGQRRELWLTDGAGHWARVGASGRFETIGDDGGPSEYDRFHGAYRAKGT